MVCVCVPEILCYTCTCVYFFQFLTSLCDHMTNKLLRLRHLLGGNGYGSNFGKAQRFHKCMQHWQFKRSGGQTSKCAILEQRYDMISHCGCLDSDQSRLKFCAKPFRSFDGRGGECQCPKVLLTYLINVEVCRGQPIFSIFVSKTVHSSSSGRARLHTF